MTCFTRPIRLFRLLVVAVGLTGAVAQQDGWQTGQINATMCYWEQPRSAVVRDTLYIDGGNLWWIPGMEDGSYGPVTDDGNTLGMVYTLNFSVPFSTDDNTTGLFGVLPKSSGASNNRAPNYLDGALLGNDDEWFMYGGLLRKTAAYSTVAGDAVLGYEAEQYGVEKPAFKAGFVDMQLPTGVTRYVAYGGAASAPSENKAWYFSGLRAPSWGPIYTVTGNDSATAVNISNTLITLDLATQQKESWRNDTLPASVPGRANPELVWVPVGAQGLLVAFGGVVYPEFVTPGLGSENEAASRAQSPKFMTTVDVYDVANQTWYRQPTAGTAPGQLARGCSVVATAADMSSINIYYYGGYDGLDATGDFNDAVYVLSLPSFRWITVSSGSPAHARAGHRCAAPYPDLMLVVGGYASMPGSAPSCVAGGIVQLFNLSTAAWVTAYDPRDWAAYSVPDAVVKAIGGSGSGGATATAPAAAATGWATAALGRVFATAYPTSKLVTNYPYALSTTATSTTTTGASATPTNTAPPTKHSSSVPGFVPPLLGVILGLMVVTAAAVVFFLWRRRKLLRGGGRSGGNGGSGGTRTRRASDAGTYSSAGGFIFSWLQNVGKTTPVAPASASYDESGSHLNPPTGPRDSSHQRSSTLDSMAGPGTGTGTGAGTSLSPEREKAGLVEADDTPIYEMPATGPVELAADFVHSRVAAELDSTVAGSSSNVHSSSSSSGSSNTKAPSSDPRRVSVGTFGSRPDSPSLGRAVLPAASLPWAGTTVPASTSTTTTATFATNASVAAHRGSGVSEVSDQDRVHLRQHSDGGSSVTSGVSSLVSPTSAANMPALMATGPPTAAAAASAAKTTTAPLPPRPLPIPEGDEVEAEASSTQAQAPEKPQTPTASSPVRKSIFRENEADLSG